MRKTPYLVGALVVLALYLFMLKHIVDNPKAHQWDFRIYYAAAKAQATGLNPYDNEVISAIAQEKIELKFQYPPLALNFFRLFTFGDYDRAFHAFLFLKAFLFLFVVVLWRKTFVGFLGPFYYLACLLAFKSAVFIDLRSGNKEREITEWRE